MRKLKFAEAISEATVQGMERDKNVIIMGNSISYSTAALGTTKGPLEKFRHRVFETPSMENALTGIAIGAAAVGKRPIVYHARADFLFLAMDQMINLAAKWKYMYGLKAGAVPIVVRAVIGKGWGQGATHSQSLHSIFAHFPGINVVLPYSAYDAKGLLLAALSDDSPTLMLEHRTLYNLDCEVPEEIYEIPFGSADVIRAGTDVTVVTCSFMVQEALIAAEELANHGVSIEVINLRSIRPLDEKTIISSIKKTGRLLSLDSSWELCGISSEVAGLAAEKCFADLKCSVRRMSAANCPLPVSMPLESAFYPKASNIVKNILSMVGKNITHATNIDYVDNFKGPY